MPETEQTLSKSNMVSIIYQATGVHIHLKNQKNFYIFTNLFWNTVKGRDRYLIDVDFNDLNRQARRDFVVYSFKLWTAYETERQ